jgi:hypothetical protein
MANNMPQTKDWAAYENQMPSTGSTGDKVPFYVIGTVTVGKLSDKPHLAKASPQGTVSSELILELTVDTSGTGATVINDKPVRYDDQVSKGQYKTVLVVWQGETVTNIKVQVVS